MPSDQRPPFPTYLLPNFSFALHRRHSSTTSETSIPALTHSPASSTTTTPSSSPPSVHFLLSRRGINSNEEALQTYPDQEQGQHQYHAREPSPSSSDSRSRAPETSPRIEATKPRLRRVQPNTLKCNTCATDIAFASQIVSKGFTGRHGRAYLVASPTLSAAVPPSKISGKRATNLVNTKIGRAVDRDLLTGAHVVADVSCVVCQTVIGWKYVDAKEVGQRYKIGKFILETKRVVGFSSWEDSVGHAEEADDSRTEEMAQEGQDNSVVVFDEADEDECEDLFAGIWDPEVVAKRRNRRVAMRRILDAEV